jgi:chromosome partition protein MukB
MTRTHAEALALVNWKGVFYERYLLDRHVTALEGANGAGKTTVMIAAYVVLLPDMSRLRFTNLGETGATGGDKGIWGRLGEPGRPSYAVLDFALPGKRRLVAGVHLERKGEPSVEPTPFIVAGLADDVRLQDLLLVSQGESEVVPELPELRENAARLGGRLTSFTSAREYFAALFDQGVTPLRLGTDEERNKLNEMLRTSMTGGISRALTSELRSFLLKEEGGLADTLQRMRANLDACRRTRDRGQESRRLELEIGGVFEAGQTMFAAALPRDPGACGRAVTPRRGSGSRTGQRRGSAVRCPRRAREDPR